jgi:hypothetical protein
MKDPRFGPSRSMRVVKLKPDSSLNVHALEGSKVTIKISIAYRDGADAIWKLKSIQEATVRGGGNPPPTTEPKPV